MDNRNMSEDTKPTIFKTGLQGLNRMFGSTGGFTNDEIILFTSHTGNLFPPILFKFVEGIISSTPSVPTNTIPTVIVILLVDKPEPDDRLKSHRGSEFDLVLLYRIRGVYGYSEWVKDCDDLKDKGHSICGCVVNNLSHMRMDNVDLGIPGQPKLVAAMGNYAEGFPLILGLRADINKACIVTDGQGLITKRLDVTNLNYIGSVAREVSFVAHLDMKVHQPTGQSYLTITWVKHRYHLPPPEMDRFTAYRLNNHRITDDVNGQDMSVSDIYINSKELTR